MDQKRDELNHLVNEIYETESQLFGAHSVGAHFSERSNDATIFIFKDPVISGISDIPSADSCHTISFNEWDFKQDEYEKCKEELENKMKMLLLMDGTPYRETATQLTM